MAYHFMAGRPFTVHRRGWTGPWAGRRGGTRAGHAGVQENCGKSPERIVHRLHSALRATRGAVVGIAEIDLDTRKYDIVA